MKAIALRLVAIVISLAAATATCRAQMIVPPAASGGTRVATLQEVLVTNLRATRSEQREFLRRVERAVAERRIDTPLVMAVMRYSQRRNPPYPFPYFERALRHEASKRGVHLPAVAAIASTAAPQRR